MNTTGKKPTPPEIRKWNWGAFLLNWIWGIRHGVWLSLLAFIPIFNIVWVFVLGAKGSQWAWENGHWDSVEAFKKTQRRWSIAGFSILILSILFCVSLFFGIHSILNNSIPAKQSFQLVRTNAEVQNMVGTPMKRSSISGSISTQSAGTGKAQLSYVISGPKAKARVDVLAIKKDHQWHFLKLYVVNKANDKVILRPRELVSPQGEIMKSF